MRQIQAQSLKTIAVISVAAATLSAQQPPAAHPTSHTQVVLLGTGTPAIDPDRSGPATAVVVNGSAYLVDFGAGVVRRAKSAVIDRGIAALEPTNIRVAFVTHLHHDHTVGYADLIFSPSSTRRVPLEVFGPTGIKAMTDHIIQAYRVDIETRLRDAKVFGFSRVPEGYQVNAHEIQPGVIYQDANVKVTAFPTKHSMESYGYRFDTPDRSIVISGDTYPTESTVQACNGCDVLIHELEMPIKPPTTSFGKSLEAFGAKYHTNVDQLADLAKKAKPRLLIIYHAAVSQRPATAGPDSSSISELFNAIAARYAGHVVVGQDLDVY